MTGKQKSLRLIIQNMWFAIQSIFGWMYRRIWHRGIKLLWNKSWIRKDPLHRSLDMDHLAMQDMNHRQLKAYKKDCVNRRAAALARKMKS